MNTTTNQAALTAPAELAQNLGIRITGAALLPEQHVSREEREQYNFGDLPANLIRAVQCELGFLVPDSMPAHVPLRLAGTVLQLVRNTQGNITQAALLEHVREQKAIRDGATLAELAVYTGVIGIAHYFGRAYYAEL